MHHKGHESSSRKLVWVEGLSVARLGCSECACVFNPCSLLVGSSLDEMKRNLQAQLNEEFASHLCVEHPWVKGAIA
jgi:hypothetical protein